MMELHKPDNGLLATCLEYSTYKFLMEDLKEVCDESLMN